MYQPARPATRSLLIGLLTALLVAGCGAGQSPSHSAPAAPAPMQGPGQQQQRDIVTTGRITIAVGDVGGAADRLTTDINDLGGRIDDRSEHTAGGGERSADFTVRVPSPKLDEFLADARGLGTVTTLSVQHEDVTEGRVDLDARIAALQASVDRLTALMKNASSTADLLAAEKALSERQADLDSLRNRRTKLGEQIEYATMTVTLSSTAAAPGPGFIASVRRGWQALLSTGADLVTIAGFLLPWSPVIAVVGWGLWRLRRRSRRRQRERSSSSSR